MNCERTSAVSLLVVALLVSSLLTPRLPTACARHVVVLKANSGLDIIGHVDLATTEPSVSTGDLSAVKKGSEGRKLGARDMEETEAGVVKEAPGKTGKADSVVNAGARPRTAKMHSVTTRHRDAATELYDMLKRDYASRARRRSPINNGEQPLQGRSPS